MTNSVEESLQKKRNRVRGLRGAVTIAQRMVDANKADIALGLPYEHWLGQSTEKLIMLKLSLERAEKDLELARIDWTSRA